MAYSKFSRRELEAMQEALIFRTAGEMGDDALPQDDYEKALDKVGERLSRYGKPFRLD